MLGSNPKPSGTLMFGYVLVYEVFYYCCVDWLLVLGEGDDEIPFVLTICKVEPASTFASFKPSVSFKILPL